MWFWIWTVLVLGAGAALFLVGRDTWRRARAALHEAGATGQLLESLNERIEARVPPVRPLPVPVLAADRRRLADELDRVRAVRCARRARRAQRHLRTQERWLAHWR